MRPVDQKQFFDAEKRQSGDCWRACLASILELDLEDIPHFVQEQEFGSGKNFLLETEAWLVERGLWLLNKQLPEGSSWRGPGTGYFILSGKSPRGDWEHAVVSLGGEIVHDPHPSRAGLDGSPTSVGIFVALDPSDIVTKTFNGDVLAAEEVTADANS